MNSVIQKVKELRERLRRKEITFSQFEEALDDVLECPVCTNSAKEGDKK